MEHVLGLTPCCHRSMIAAARMSVAENLLSISAKVTAAHSAADPATRASAPPRLVAVSKTKPVEMIVAAYEAGHRHFGENYIQELVDKSHDAEIQTKCPDIRYSSVIIIYPIDFDLCQVAFYWELSNEQSKQAHELCQSFSD